MDTKPVTMGADLGRSPVRTPPPFAHEGVEYPYLGFMARDGGTRFLPTLYVDQAGLVVHPMVFSDGKARWFASALTPIGVRDLESAFMMRIRALDCQGPPAEDPGALEREILADPHLHPAIKSNLVDNLRRVVG